MRGNDRRGEEGRRRDGERWRREEEKGERTSDTLVKSHFEIDLLSLSRSQLKTSKEEIDEDSPAAPATTALTMMDGWMDGWMCVGVWVGGWWMADGGWWMISVIIHDELSLAHSLARRAAPDSTLTRSILGNLPGWPLLLLNPTLTSSLYIHHPRHPTTTTTIVSPITPSPPSPPPAHPSPPHSGTSASTIPPNSAPGQAHRDPSRPEPRTKPGRREGGHWGWGCP